MADQLKIAVAALAAKLKEKDPFFALGTDVISSELTSSVSTGCLPLDVILSSPSNPKGGIPYGRVIEIFGGESEGKTTLAESIVAQHCKGPGLAELILAEGSIDKKRIVAQGVDLELIITKEVHTLEEGFQSIETVLNGRDSVVKTIPFMAVFDTISQCDVSSGTGGMTDIPRVMHHMKRQYTSLFSRSGMCMIFISQIMDSIGGHGGSGSQSGGRALKFWASLRLELKRIGWIDGPGGREGIWVKVNLFKSKICVPWRSVNVAINFKRGVDNDLSMWNFLKDRPVKFSDDPNAPAKPIFWVDGSWNKFLSPMGTESSFHFEEFPEIMNRKSEAWVPANHLYGTFQPPVESAIPPNAQPLLFNSTSGIYEFLKKDGVPIGAPISEDLLKRTTPFLINVEVSRKKITNYIGFREPYMPMRDWVVLNCWRLKDW